MTMFATVNSQTHASDAKKDIFFYDQSNKEYYKNIFEV